jgi:hypothetical protein
VKYTKTLKYRPTGNGNAQFKLGITINTKTPFETYQLLMRLGFAEHDLRKNFSTYLGKGEAPFNPVLPLNLQTNQNPDDVN